MNVVQAAWREVSLGDICEFRYGKSLPEKSRQPGPHAVYGSNGAVGSHTAALTGGPTIVIGRKGSIGEVSFSSAACWPIDTTYFVDPSCTKQDLRWLSRALATLGLSDLNKSAAVPGLNRDDAYRQKLLLPPLSEQRRIAAILDEADALRAKRRAALAQLDEMARAIFVEMFGDAVANPKSLPVRALSELIDPARPITYGILKPGPDIPNGVPYVRVVDMSNGTVNFASVRRTSPEIAREYRRSTLQRGDLLISIRGHVGRVAVTPPELSGANITQDTARLAVVGVDALFLQGLLESDAVREWMDRRTKGAAVQGINLGDLRQLPVLVPPESDQRVYAARVQQLRAWAQGAQAQRDHLDRLFASLQHRAFRGEL